MRKKCALCTHSYAADLHLTSSHIVIHLQGGHPIIRNSPDHDLDERRHRPERCVRPRGRPTLWLRVESHFCERPPHVWIPDVRSCSPFLDGTARQAGGHHVSLIHALLRDDWCQEQRCYSLDSANDCTKPLKRVFASVHQLLARQSVRISGSLRPSNRPAYGYPGGSTARQFRRSRRCRSRSASIYPPNRMDLSGLHSPASG